MLELNCKTFKVERELETGLPILTIVVLENDFVVVSHSVTSGYMEERSGLQIVKPGSDYKFHTVEYQSLEGTGNVYQILVNSLEPTELILAC